MFSVVYSALFFDAVTKIEHIIQVNTTIVYHDTCRERGRNMRYLFLFYDVESFNKAIIKKFYE